MLCYRGFLQMGEWKLKDIGQILNGLYLCQMYCKSERYRKCQTALPSINDLNQPSFDDLALYKLVIDSLVDFLKDLKVSGIKEFDNPPVVFLIEDRVVYLYQSSCTEHYLHKEIIHTIEEKLKGTEYKVKACNAPLSYYNMVKND